MRDILVPFTKPRHEEEALSRLNAQFDAVLVHGDRNLVALELSVPWIAGARLPFHYTGYVLRDRPAPQDETDEILVSAGGGAVGAALFRVAVETAKRMPEFSWRIVGGPSLAQAALDELAGSAPSNLAVERARGDLALLMAKARACVMQAGYNSVAEALAVRARMILVPWESGHETEQRERARILEAKGLAVMLRQTGLSAESLGRAVAEIARRPRPMPQIALDGARQTGKILSGLTSPHARP